ncbi:OLC1v1026574C1 [Oldenlandia corymbosa var. corymbosa]|nr:OLC1v1026574C1 [Oldenlandia corymbosa var. corymbosa]
MEAMKKCDEVRSEVDSEKVGNDYHLSIKSPLSTDHKQLKQQLTNLMMLLLLFIPPFLLFLFVHLLRREHVLISPIFWDQLIMSCCGVVANSRIFLGCFLTVFLGTLYFKSRPREVYLVDFACFKPGPELLASNDILLDKARKRGTCSEESLSFMKAVTERSGLAPETYMPPAAFDESRHYPGMADGRKEAEMIMFGAVDQLLAKTSGVVRTSEIGILVVNCTMFCPTPSLSSTLVNHYKLRSNILSYNLGGMACSAGVLAIDLAKQLLQVNPNSYALIVSLECISPHFYSGNDKSMLVTNCLFRLGGAAVLLSNKSCDRRHSKYRLLHSLLTTTGADDTSYKCTFQREDDDNIVGLSLSKDILKVAAETLRINLTRLGPLVLPISEKLKYLFNLVGRKVLNMKIQPYVPDFKLAFQHFCIHAGGKQLLNGMEKELGLTEWLMEPSRMTLYRPRKVYLVDFACFKPGPQLQASHDVLLDKVRQTGTVSEKNINFMKGFMGRSGMGHKTFLPEIFFDSSRVRAGMADARTEAEMLMFGAVDQLLAKTGVNTKEIGVLVVNCSTFCPTPSLSAAVVNHYKLRSNVLSYNLGGMGCSAGIIALDLAKQLLQVNPDTYALIVSLESIAINLYGGNNHFMLVSNCYFRLGGAAILLTNKPSDRGRSKYQLLHSLRATTAADDKSYKCIFQQEDEDGEVGVTLTLDCVGAAKEAVRLNLTALAPLVLPISEQLKWLFSVVGRNVLKMKMEAYVPDFKRAFEHFCIHTGGKQVFNAMEKHLGLTKWLMEPSRMTFYRYGNLSSSSVWYELAYIEAKGRIKRGDRICQIGLGSGFKCNTAVWSALRTIDPANEIHNPWLDEIDQFPVDLCS